MAGQIDDTFYYVNIGTPNVSLEVRYIETGEVLFKVDLMSPHLVVRKGNDLYVVCNRPGNARISHFLHYDLDTGRMVGPHITTLPKFLPQIAWSRDGLCSRGKYIDYVVVFHKEEEVIVVEDRLMPSSNRRLDHFAHGKFIFVDKSKLAINWTKVPAQLALKGKWQGDRLVSEDYTWHHELGFQPRVKFESDKILEPYNYVGKDYVLGKDLKLVHISDLKVVEGEGLRAKTIKSQIARTKRHLEGLETELEQVQPKRVCHRED